ncbi:MAG: DegV family protein, partial [Chloroflexota bacterium]|nr:DegV family protein [Chloroflexota bacterium]
SWIGMGYEQATKAKNMARRELPKTKIETIDTHTEHGAQLLCVLEAVRLAAAGKSFAEIVDGVNRLVPKLNLLYILDTVYYMGRGGRMGRADAWTDSALDVRSILELDASTGGAMTPVARARTKAKAIEKSVAIMKERNGSGKLHVVVSHDDVPEEAEQLKQRLLSQLPVSEIHIAGVSPVTIVHNGPGALRVGWYSEEPGG